MAWSANGFSTEGLPEPVRATALRGAIEQAFPGMQVSHIDAGASGRLSAAKLAHGAIFGLETSGKSLRWSPPAHARAELFVLLTVRGESSVSHAGRAAQLSNEQFVFVDCAHPFELSVKSSSSHVLLQLPDFMRSEGRFADDTLARASSPSDAGDLHLARSLRSLASSASEMSAEQRAIAEHALTSVVTLASALRRDPPELSLWLRRASELIETHALAPDFDADALAARVGVSRRYLDRVFAKASTTAAREIWERRLRWAGDALRAPHHAHRTILDVALSAGFSDAAHFSRVFRRRFGCTPSAWRGGEAKPHARRPS